MKIAIKANPDRGKEIISLLKSLGGINEKNWKGDGETDTYYIDKDNKIQFRLAPAGYKIYTLEEFEKKLSNENWRYKNIFDNSQYPQSFECPEGYIFKDENGNVINAKKIVLEKKKNEYPKTYEECCKVLGLNHYLGLSWNSYDVYSGVINCLPKRIEDIAKKLESLSKLLICRDAYWKIAGEEMGLDKPWKPDYDSLKTKYTIVVVENKVVKLHTLSHNHILTFPTEEMRDAFKENFDPDLEICKEFL